MQRSNQPATISIFTTPQDKELWLIKESLELSYWNSKTEGVFEFQFVTDNQPLTNVPVPHMFQLIRYTPNYSYESFQTVIPGRLNNDETFEYGGGRKGIITANGIKWNDGTMWHRLQKIPNKRQDQLDLGKIQAQARMDSRVLMGDIYTTNYLY